jgi:hypothetical protein
MAFLLGRPNVFSYHRPQPVGSSHTQPNLSRRQARWMEYLQRFRFTWHYKPGKDNIADPLSRHPSTNAQVNCANLVCLLAMQTRSHKRAPQEPTRPTQVRKRKRQDVHTSQADSRVDENLHPLERNTEPIEGEGDCEASNVTHHSTQDVGSVTGDTQSDPLAVSQVVDVLGAVRRAYGEDAKFRSGPFTSK